MNTEELAKKVQEYARLHYHTNGWDIIEECYGTSTIILILEQSNVSTLHGAIKTFRDIAIMKDERRSEYSGEF